MVTHTLQGTTHLLWESNRLCRRNVARSMMNHNEICFFFFFSTHNNLERSPSDSLQNTSCEEYADRLVARLPVLAELWIADAKLVTPRAKRSRRREMHSRS